MKGDQGGQGDGPSLQQIECARKVLGDARVNDLQQSDKSPTQEEMEKLKPCFPEGFPDQGAQGSRTK